MFPNGFSGGRRESQRLGTEIELLGAGPEILERTTLPLNETRYETEKPFLVRTLAMVLRNKVLGRSALDIKMEEKTRKVESEQRMHASRKLVWGY